jgi:hypothetical protein
LVARTSTERDIDRLIDPRTCRSTSHEPRSVLGVCGPCLPISSGQPRYSKPNVSACNGFHAAFTNGKINDHGNYQLRGNFKIQTPTGVKLGGFTFDFRITR